MLDNVQIAILIKVNELADRFGIKPYDFVAVIDNNQVRNTVLRYEVPVSGAPVNVAKFDKMLDLIGLGEATHELQGTNVEIIEALDNALLIAPKKRTRH